MVNSVQKFKYKQNLVATNDLLMLITIL